jgi:DNA-binding NarL/FixJ family response regulator
MASLRIFVAQENETARRGTVSLLASQPGWEVCGEAGDGQEVVEKVAQLRPNIVLLDMDMPKMNGWEATRQIVHSPPFPKVIILIFTDLEQLVREALHIGVRGVVLKTDASGDLVSAVEALQHGRPFFTPRVAELIVQGYLKAGTTKESPETTLKMRDRGTGELASSRPRQWNKRGMTRAVRKYLPIAVIVAAAATIGWFTFNRKSDLQLTVMDKMLVRLGLKTPPPPVYNGNPDTKVWIDLHTALYYCPGEGLYGKTPKGKFAKQRDAQLDHFEPASRQTCD